MQSSLRRKIVYIVSLGILVLLLYFIGRPAQVIQTDGEVRSASGGWLAQYRTDANLTEAQLGEIDPASNTIKLATFGMRGIAMYLLWHQAEEKKKRHQWNDVVALANQIIFLEPHFETIWVFLGWTLSYNASAEFDDYRERYRWVIRGIDFLVSGLERNKLYPKLYKETGWVVSNKIGMADEVEQYRRLLKADEEFGERHDCKLPSERDNWILGRRWYHLGEDLVLRGISLGNMSDFVFFANSRLNLFNYAKWLRKDGIFGEPAMKAWRDSLVEWKDFGSMDLATAIPGDGTYRVNKDNEHTVKRAKLETVDIIKEEEKTLIEELNGLYPELKKEICIDRWKNLGEVPGQQGSIVELLKRAYEINTYYPIEELRVIRQWLDENEPDWTTRLTADLNVLYSKDQDEKRKIPVLFLNEEDRAELRLDAEKVSQVSQRVLSQLYITPKILVDEIQELDIPREKKNRAREIEQELDTKEQEKEMSELFRGIVNYEPRFWEVAVESHPFADDAHRLRYEARNAYYAGERVTARNGWIEAMKKWDALLDLGEFKRMATTSDFVRDRIDIVEKFLVILDDANMIFSDISADPVPLKRLMWFRIFGENDSPNATYVALDYAVKEYQNALTEPDTVAKAEKLEKLEGYFQILINGFAGFNAGEKFMGYAPFFDMRDRIVETVAFYIKTLEQQGKSLPEMMPLRSYIELMIRHDPSVASAKEVRNEVLPLIQERKYDEAIMKLDQAVADWVVLLDKYPIIGIDKTNPDYAFAAWLANQYAEVLRAQEKVLPEDFPLKSFLL